MKISLANQSRLFLSTKILFLASLFCFIMLFRGAYVDRSTWSYDSFETMAPAGLIVPGTEFSQELSVKFNGSINKFSFHLATYARPNYHLETSKLEFTFTNLRTCYTYTDEVVTGTLIDNGWLEISIENSMQVRKGDIIDIKITSPDTNESNAPTIWLLTNAISNNATVRTATINSIDLPGSFSLSYNYNKYDMTEIVLTSILFLLLVVVTLLKFQTSSEVAPDKHLFQRPLLANFIRLFISILLIPTASFLLLQRYVMQEHLTNQWSMIIPLILFLLVHLVLCMIFTRFSISFLLVNFFFLALHIINLGKRNIRGDVFLAPDVFAAKEASAFIDSQMLISLISGKTIVFIFLVILIVVVVKFNLDINICWISRLITTSISIGLIFLLFTNLFYDFEKLKNNYGIENIRWEQTQNVNSNGFFQVFFMNSDVLFVKKPIGYSRKSAEALIAKYEVTKISGEESGSLSVLPDNIIVVMNESFFDLSLIDDELAKYEYMPFTKELMKNFPSGSTVVPVIGGATCNTEFEFLTGNSMAFLPSGSLPYQQYVNRDNENSIVNALNEVGYKTIATHPNVGSFWNRSYVYDKLGFDEFYDIHDYIRYSGELEQNRGMYTDRSVYDMILKTIDESEQPNFVFAVTMQNHTPYNQDGMEAQYEVTGDESVSDDLRIFLNLMKKSDEDLKYFVAELNKLEESSVLLFFGDHAPPLGAGFYDQIDFTDILAKYSSPYFIYSTDNYDGLRYLNKDGSLNRISSNYLGFYLLDLLGFEKSLFHTHLSYAMQEDPVLSPHKNIAETDDSSHLHNYEILQYHYLFASR